MYKYSPISNLKIKNFRNLGDIDIDFSDSPIVTLVGDNEAGKTSVIKAFSTCALHSNPKEQKDFIRDNTKMFGVEIDLADGTQIVRCKENGGMNLYRIIYPDGKVWDITKITDGLPVEVENLMGLIKEPETGEFLHVRTYEDKLLFVVTPSSANYKVMYNALKVEQLTKAIKIGSSEVNAIKSKISSNEVSVQTLKNQLRSINVIDIETVVSTRDRLKQQLKVLDKLEKAKNLKDRVADCEKQLGALALIDRFSLQPVNELTTSKISSAGKLIDTISKLNNKRNELKSLDSLQEIGTDSLNKFESIVRTKKLLSLKINQSLLFKCLDESTEVSEVLSVQLINTKSLLNKLNTLKTNTISEEINNCHLVEQSDIEVINKLNKVYLYHSDISTKKKELDVANSYVEQTQDYLKQCGVAVEACPKCGEAVIFDIDKLE